jgi:hypothetical protein
LTFATFARLLILVILPNLPELTFNLPICHFWKLLEDSGNGWNSASKLRLWRISQEYRKISTPPPYLVKINTLRLIDVLWNYLKAALKMRFFCTLLQEKRTCALNIR